MQPPRSSHPGAAFAQPNLSQGFSQPGGSNMNTAPPSNTMSGTAAPPPNMSGMYGAPTAHGSSHSLARGPPGVPGMGIPPSSGAGSMAPPTSMPSRGPPQNLATSNGVTTSGFGAPGFSQGPPRGPTGFSTSGIPSSSGPLNSNVPIPATTGMPNGPPKGNVPMGPPATSGPPRHPAQQNQGAPPQPQNIAFFNPSGPGAAPMAPTTNAPGLMSGGPPTGPPTSMGIGNAPTPNSNSFGAPTTGGMSAPGHGFPPSTGGMGPPRQPYPAQPMGTPGQPYPPTGGAMGPPSQAYPPSSGPMGPPGQPYPPSSGAMGIPGQPYPPTTGGMGQPGFGAPPGQFINPQQNLQSPAQYGGPPMHGTPSAPGAPVAPKMAEVDKSKCCAPIYMDLSTGVIPASDTLARKTGIPLGLCVQPLAEGPEAHDIPVVDFGSAGIVRCKKCRAYINPFSKFTDGGRRWQCNLCTFPNDVPSAYFCATDANGVRPDVEERPELSRGSVELVAPVEYMVRPPQPPVYMFCIDVSFNAISSGMLETTLNAIKESLEHLSGDERTQVGFVTFDTAVHFYSLRADNPQPNMFVVPELSDLALPCLSENLLVNLKDTREAVEALLDSLLEMHRSNRGVETCLGAAIDAAFLVMQHIGGKLVICQSNLPSVGRGKLKPRESPKVLGTDDEHRLLAPDNSPDGQFYRTIAVECSRQQISVDCFLFSPAYTDVATIGSLSRYTGGEVYYYPSFQSVVDGPRFHADLLHDLTRTTGFEAVMRVRCSAGVNITNFYGSFFIRGNDLLTLPNVTCDTAFNVELNVVDNLQPGSVLTIQSALLYTTSFGERRLCVHTLAAPVTTVLADIFSNASVNSVQNMIAKIALDHTLRTGLPAARRYLHRAVVDVVRAYGLSAAQGMGPQSHQSGSINLPENLQLLPLYGMSMQKSVLFRGGSDVRSDERAFLVYHMLMMSMSRTRHYAYPRMFSLHDMPSGAGKPLEGGVDENISVAGYSNIRLPELVSLTAEKLREDGVYMLADGIEMFLWVGRSAPAPLLESLFGVHTLQGLDVSQAQLPQLDNEYSVRVNSIVAALQEESVPQMKFRIAQQGAGDFNEVRFHWRMVEDRQTFQGGNMAYADYLQVVARESSMGAMAPGLAR